MSQPAGLDATTSLDAVGETFVDRRGRQAATDAPARERRQFADGRENLSPEARELADAIDGYKLRHRRRFIDYDELHSIICSLGYRR